MEEIPALDDLLEVTVNPLCRQVIRVPVAQSLYWEEYKYTTRHCLFVRSGLRNNIQV